MSTQSQPATDTLPIRFGSEEEFQTVREYFAASGFTRETVQARVAEDLPDASTAEAAEFGRDPQSAVELLTWIFVLGQTSRPEHVGRFVPLQVLPALAALGLLARDQSGAYFSPVFLAPLDGLYFAVDRWFSPDGAKIPMRTDVVYPATTPTTLRFLNLLPRTPCQSLLDIGCGSGVLGLVAASAYAESVCATDITERSCLFTEFNRRLSGITNAQVLQGDLYTPVTGEAFDRIVAHPPYVPALKANWTFADGGADGELLTRKIVEGLPAHLVPGGVFLCDATGSDRNLPFEQRVRQWLGDSEAEFDVAVLVRKSYEPQIFAKLMAGRYTEMGTADEWQQSFQSQEISRILQMTLVIQRAAAPRQVFTARRTWGDKESGAAVEWLVASETRSAGGDLEWVLRERPRLPQGLTMLTTSRGSDTGFVPTEYRVTTQYPFASQNILQPWIASLLNLCDGSRAVGELFQIFVENGDIPADASEKFAALVANLASGGLVELPSFPLPRE